MGMSWLGRVDFLEGKSDPVKSGYNGLPLEKCIIPRVHYNLFVIMACITLPVFGTWKKLHYDKTSIIQKVR